MYLRNQAGRYEYDDETALLDAANDIEKGLHVKPIILRRSCTFGDAIEALRDGKKAKRTAWTGVNAVWLDKETLMGRSDSWDEPLTWSPKHVDTLACDWEIFE